MNDNFTELDRTGELDAIFDNTGEDTLDLGGDPGSDIPPDPFASEDSPQPEPLPETANTKESAPPKEQPAAPIESPIEEASKAANPLAALKTAEKEQTVKKNVFSQPAIFRYEGKESEIENPELSFDQLRIQMAEKFVALDEKKKVSWKIRYGSVTRAVADVNKTIRAERESIETSRNFLEHLKKTKDKAAVRCYVEPYVTTSGKGASCEAAAFLSEEEAIAGSAGICILPGRSGKVMEMRKTDLGRFVTEVEGRSYLPDVRAGFYPALPLIPYQILAQIICFFRSLMKQGHELEALVRLYWDKEGRTYFPVIPRQEVSKYAINARFGPEDILPPERFVHVMDIHSHHAMEAIFSPTDDRDETETRLYTVIGKLQNFFPDVTVRLSNNGQFLPVSIGDVFALPQDAYPPYWHTALSVCREEAAL